MPFPKDVTPEEIDLSLEAIARHPKGADEIGRPPGVVTSVTGSQGRNIYLNFIKSADLPPGAIYRTWVVQFSGGKVTRVSYFRSRRGAFGDETLPDDD